MKRLISLILFFGMLLSCPLKVYGVQDTSGPGTEKLLSTLNETLEENRKIRQNMRDLQDAFEKITLERNELVTQMRRFEGAALKRDKESTEEIETLSEDLEKSRKNYEALKAKHEKSEEVSKRLETELESIGEMKAKYEEMLKTAVLDSERDVIQEAVKSNELAVEEAIGTVSGLETENVQLREALIETRFSMGNMYYGMGEYEKAAQEFEALLKWQPMHEMAHHNLAVTYDYHLNKKDLARKHYEAYLNLKPADEAAGEVRLRVWDLKNLARVKPDSPLKKDFEKYN